MQTKPLQASDYRIRKLIGFLGLILPVILPIVQGDFFASISHYYYRKLSALMFIIILSAFGLFLISYKGYIKDPSTENISDDFLTNIAGFAVLVLVFIPTSCSGSSNEAIALLCNNRDKVPLALFGHCNQSLNTIHLVSSGVFILCMGWMSRYKFTRSLHDPNIFIYKWCGNIVFIAVGLIILFMLLEKYTSVAIPFKAHYVYVFETLAIIPFGISWLIKGDAIDNIKSLMK